jgi:hypothetical protein
MRSKDGRGGAGSRSLSGACQEPVSAAAVKLLRRQEGEREGGGGGSERQVGVKEKGVRS